MASTETSREKAKVKEPKFSAETAKLQLHIGRTAHGYGVIVALVLTLNAILAYLLEFTGIFSDPPFSGAVVVLWTFPMIVGIGVGISALALKWEHYSYERSSAHFILTVLGLAVPAVGLPVVLVSEFGFLRFQYLPWIYPISVAGLSFTMVSMAMTWLGRGMRKASSIVFAIVPIMLFILIMATSHLPSYLPLVMGYLGSALCFQLSGSMLHVLASSTSAHERHIIRADGDKLMALQNQLESREAMIEYKEKALVGREAHLETYDKELARAFVLVESRRKELAKFQAQVDNREAELLATEKRVGSKKADIDAKMNEIELAKGEVKAANEKLERSRDDLARTAANITRRESKLKRRELQMEAKTRDLTALEKAMAKEKQRHAEVRDELTRKRAELMERERELTALPQEVPQTQVIAPGEEGQARDLAEWERNLSEKGEELNKMRMEIDMLSDELERKEVEAKERESAFSERMAEFKSREEEFLNKELALADREARLAEGMENLNREKSSMNGELKRLQERETEYKELTAEARKKVTDYDSLKEQVGTKGIELQHKETTIRELEARLEKESRSIDERTKSLIEREKQLEEKEAMLNLRLLGRPMVDASGQPVKSDTDEKEKALRVREERLKQKEQEIKRLAYQREKELEMREKALQQQLKEDIADKEELVLEERKVEKVKTGISRLDDLLFGGIPFNSNVLFVGPSFLGKEVAMLNFVAEGLKKGIPAVIVTTSKPPEEITKDMGPVLMEFVEYERIGLVKWIDATSQIPSEAAGFDGEKRIYKVNGASDLDRILQGLHEIGTLLLEEHPYFRIAYLSLSPSVSRSDRNAAYEFIQRMINDLRKTKFVGAFALEKGMHDQKEIETIEHQMDGAIMFKQEDKKTFLSVQGVCDVQTRDWVQYKQTHRGLIIGAFSLERIK